MDNYYDCTLHTINRNTFSPDYKLFVIKKETFLSDIFLSIVEDLWNLKKFTKKKNHTLLLRNRIKKIKKKNNAVKIFV